MTSNARAAPAVVAAVATPSDGGSRHMQPPGSKRRQPVPPLVHAIAGGLGGTAGALLTNPVEVVKTRLQSAGFDWRSQPQVANPRLPSALLRINTIRCLHDIVVREGGRGLWRGVGANLIGIVPSRSLYFATYSTCKRRLTRWNQGHESPLVHLGAAGCASFSVSTLTNPLWVVKTRVQLETGVMGAAHTWHTAADIWRTEGIRGFYKGITASYAGMAETVLHFVLYEQAKRCIREDKVAQTSAQAAASSFVAAASAKLVASLTTYPHEVARTRMRQTGFGDKYKSFFNTLRIVYLEEGVRGLYGGLGTHLFRTVPNSAVMFATYELVCHVARNW
eukprot:m.90041 g.90041  ORF g.90041 m.90041 type:complete len:335 (+) comp14991_c0_seq1:358-1362(+)